MNYFENKESKIIRGYDLKIDAKILALCDLSNKSSSHTRAILYVVVIVCVTSIIAVINTFPYANWTKERILDNVSKLTNVEKKIIDQKNSVVRTQNTLNDSINNEAVKNYIELELQNNLSNKNEKIGIVQLPIIGNAFDINNLSILTGISFVFLMIILRYTLSREKKNLRIALHAITQRYPTNDGYINELSKIIDIVPENFFSAIKNNDLNLVLDEGSVNIYNTVRRRYHYNYLTMNEIFNTPEDPLTETERKDEKEDTMSFKNSQIAKFVAKNLFYLPFSFYLAIFINDSLSIPSGIRLSAMHTILQFGFSYFCLMLISILCYECNNQKLICQTYYKNFKNNGYTFNYSKNEIFLPDRTKNMWKYPIALIYNFIKKLF